jgi:hypothetical protein
MSELASARSAQCLAKPTHTQTDRPISPALMVLAWLWVLVPFCYGLFQLVIKIPALFGH